MENVNTVLFDLDGTLINSNDLIIASFEYTLEHYYPGKFKREDILSFIGPPLNDTFEAINKDQAEEMMTMYREHNHEYHDELLQEYEGVREAVDLLSKSGYKLGIVTTKRRPTTEKGLKLTGLDAYFQTVITLDDVQNAKPHPEPLQKAMEALEAVPKETLMVGDNTHDIEGGKNAGTMTAGVAWTIKGAEYLRQSKPDFLLEDMRDLPEMLGKRKA